MFSEQLRRILGEIEPSTRAHFRGVFAVDELTQTVCKPGSYVINLDKRNEPGSHWVAVYVDPNKSFNNEEEEEEEEEERGGWRQKRSAYLRQPRSHPLVNIGRQDGSWESARGENKDTRCSGTDNDRLREAVRNATAD